MSEEKETISVHTITIIPATNGFALQLVTDKGNHTVICNNPEELYTTIKGLIGE